MLQHVTEKKGTRYQALYEQIQRLPEHLVGEIIDGELYTFPRPASPHAMAAANLAVELIPPFQRGLHGPGGWWIVPEVELHLDDDVLVPDLVGWRRERMPEFERVPFFTLAPDWICEVLSPSTERIDRTKKLRIYARERIQHAWLVSALTRTVEVLSLSAPGWKTHATYHERDRIRAVPFEAIDLELAYLWGETPDSPTEGQPRSPSDVAV
jgi:Uma2 family endonuclease